MFASSALAIVPSTNIFKRNAQNTLDKDILIQSADNNDEGTKTIEIQCSNAYTALNGGPKSKTFKVVVSPDCSKESILGSALTDKTYTIHAVKLEYDFDWVTSRASCPLTVTMKWVSQTDASSTTSLVGSAIMNNNLLSNEQVSFDPAAMKFSYFWNVDNRFREESRLVELKADNLNTIDRIETFKIDILPDCSVAATVIPFASYPDKSYKVN